VRRALLANDSTGPAEKIGTRDADAGGFKLWRVGEREREQEKTETETERERVRE
jgi:hypothetical protein